MGYQESLVLVRPQWRAESIAAEYLEVRDQDTDGLYFAEVQATLTTLVPIPELHCPSGTVLLWVTGERSDNMLHGAMPNAWKPPLATMILQYPAELVQDKIDPIFLEGLHKGNVTYNKWFKYTPLAVYLAEKRETAILPHDRPRKQNTQRKERGR